MAPKEQSKISKQGQIFGIGLAAALMLSACAWDAPTRTTAGRAEVYSDDYVLEVPTETLKAAKLQDVSQHYWRYGSSPVLVTVMYDPHSPSNTAMKATQQATRIAETLHAQGIKAIDTDILPVQEAGDVSNTLITYNTVEARPPSECGEPLSMGYTDSEKDQNYALGCSVETYLARQVARPADLLGNDGQDPGEGRRAANMTNGYIGGEPNEPLEGETASDN